MKPVMKAAALLATIAAAGCGGKHDKTGAASPAPAPEKPTNETVADYRGFTEVQSLLDERLMASGAGFSLNAYLGGDDLGQNDLASLLGFEFGDGQHSEFRNGKPNAMNLVLWHMALSGVARDLAASCKPDGAPAAPGGAVPSEAFKAVLKPVCAWPDAKLKQPGALKPLWTAVLDHDAPDTEYVAFAGYFHSYQEQDSGKAVADILTAMLYNPYFLVRQ